jgi:hypothetical protein
MYIVQYQALTSSHPHTNISSAEKATFSTLPASPRSTASRLKVCVSHRKMGAAEPLKDFVPICPDAIMLPSLEIASAHTCESR